MYYQQLSYCITQFVEKDCKLADIVIRGLLKYWPITKSSKEVMFLGELEEVLEATQPPELVAVSAVLIFRFVVLLGSAIFPYSSFLFMILSTSYDTQTGLWLETIYCSTPIYTFI